jgi:hypothetical protein
MGSWKIIETPWPLILFSSASDAVSSSVLPKRTEPDTVAVRGSSPITASEVTDLPEPDSPTIPSTSPRRSP